MISGKKITAVIPSYNAGKTLTKTIQAIPPNIVDEIIVINDGSSDNTVEIAKNFGAIIVSHQSKRGYGAAQKSGFREALKNGAEIIILLHADFQYDPTCLPDLAKPLALGKADVCFGSRMHSKKSALQGGMPWWRFIANITLTFVEDSVLQLGLTEYHTGYRAYGRELLLRIPFEKNSDNYVFDTEMFAEIRLGHFCVAEVPIPTRYLKESQSPNLRQCIVYGFTTLGVLIKYLLQISYLKKYPQFEIKK
jgi:glycosyltransferase involved in cell wall biosynthesis